MTDERHDTPVDGVRLAAPRRGAALEALVGSPLRREYEAWDELRADWAAAEARLEAEARALRDQGEVLLGAVRFVPGTGGGPRALASEGVAGAEAVGETPLGEAQRTLERAQAALADSRTRLAADFLARSSQLKARLLAQAAEVAGAAAPQAELFVRPAGPQRRILHLRRPGGDEGVLLMRALGGRLPTRYDALFDDATDDVALAPPALYAEEGVRADEVRLTGTALLSRLEGLTDFWPVKGMAPMVGAGVPVRWLCRGPVLEAELAEEGGFRSLLTLEEAERVTARLLTLKLNGALHLELGRG